MSSNCLKLFWVMCQCGRSEGEMPVNEINSVIALQYCEFCG